MSISRFALRLSLIGAGVLSAFSLYQHWLLKYSGGMAAGFCDGKGVIGCNSVSISPWAEPFFGIPIAALTFSFVVFLFVLELIPKLQNRTFPLYLWMGLGSFVYLMIMFFSVRQVCPLCLATHACIWISIFFKLRQCPKIWNDQWVWKLGATLPLLLAFSIQHWGLTIVRNKKHWDVPRINEYSFIPVTAPAPPTSSPILHMGHGLKTVNLVVAVDFMCLHCREHFFELSRALKASNLSANVTILMDPLDESCNSGGGNLHPGACHAARVGLCQSKRGAFDAFFHHIYLEPGRAMGGPETLLTTESKSAEDKKNLETCVHSPETEQELTSHLNVVYLNNVAGTPTTWIGGYKFNGQLGWKDWDEIFRRIKL